MSTPMLNAARMAISTPNSRNAKKIAPMVKKVRNLRRRDCARRWERTSCDRLLRHEHALFEVEGPLGARRGMRVMRDHDDRLAVLAVERLEQIEDLVARLAIEVAGRLVAEHSVGSVTIARAMPTRCS